MSLKSKVQSPKSAAGVACCVLRVPLTRHATRNTQHASPIRRQSPATGHRTPAFTLIEIMIVVSIMAVVMTMSVPIIYKLHHQAPLTKATKDLFEVLSNARARAILQGKEVAVLFHPREGRFEIEGGGSSQVAGSGPVQVGFISGVGSGTSAKLPDTVTIQMLDINQVRDHDFRDDETARVRFFPNGIADEMTLILISGDGEQRGVALEITTGLAAVLNQADLQKLRN